MLLEQLIRFHVQSQVLVWRELLSWPAAMLSVLDDQANVEHEPSAPATITRMAPPRGDLAKAA
jgi:hypothetical protein